MAPQAAPYTLRFSDLRFELKPDRRLEWPSLQRGTILRGAFGSILKEIACDPLCTDHTACEFASECAYEKLFAPMNRPEAVRLSLNKDLPRPFVVIPDDIVGRRAVAFDDSANAAAGHDGELLLHHPGVHVERVCISDRQHAGGGAMADLSESAAVFRGDRARPVSKGLGSCHALAADAVPGCIRSSDARAERAAVP